MSFTHRIAFKRTVNSLSQRREKGLYSKFDNAFSEALIHSVNMNLVSKRTNRFISEHIQLNMKCLHTSHEASFVYARYSDLQELGYCIYILEDDIAMFSLSTQSKA